MNQYKEEIILLNAPKSRLFFPAFFSNEIYYSKLKNASYFSYQSNFSIKYIISGKEAYLLDGKKHMAHAGEYLLVNNGRIVETTETCSTEAISIFLDSDLIQEVYQTFQSSEDQLLDLGLDNKFTRLEFFEHAFNHDDHLGTLLKRLLSYLKQDPAFKSSLSKEVYYGLAEALVKSQKKVQREIGNIQQIKKQTKEELYRRILIAKDFIESTTEKQLDLELLAKHACLSKFHLIRVYKSVYGITPYQYHLVCKVNNAKKMLLAKTDNIETIAYLCGFSDLCSFSKTFKRIIGVSPSQFRAD